MEAATRPCGVDLDRHRHRMDEGAMLAYTEMDWVHFMKKGGGGGGGARVCILDMERVWRCALSPPHMNALRERDAAINRARRCLSYQCTKNIHAPPPRPLFGFFCVCLVIVCIIIIFFFGCELSFICVSFGGSCYMSGSINGRLSKDEGPGTSTRAYIHTTATYT